MHPWVDAFPLLWYLGPSTLARNGFIAAECIFQGHIRLMMRGELVKRCPNGPVVYGVQVGIHRGGAGGCGFKIMLFIHLAGVCLAITLVMPQENEGIGEEEVVLDPLCQRQRFLWLSYNFV